MQCNDLAVDIGQGNRVIVNEIQCADPGTGKGFHDIPAHTAHAEDGDAAGSEACHGCFTEQQSGS